MNCIGLYIENYFGSFLSFTVIFTPNMRTIYCECRNFVKFSLELQWIEVERKCKTRNRCVNALLNRRLISSAIVYIRVASLSLYTSVHCYRDRIFSHWFCKRQMCGRIASTVQHRADDFWLFYLAFYNFMEMAECKHGIPIHCMSHVCYFWANAVNQFDRYDKSITNFRSMFGA